MSKNRNQKLKFSPPSANASVKQSAVVDPKRQEAHEELRIANEKDKEADNKVWEAEEKVRIAEEKLRNIKKEQSSVEQNCQCLRDENQSLEQQKKEFERQRKELEESFNARRKEIDESFSVRNAELDALISERRNALEHIDAERIRVVSEIKAALDELRESAVKSGKGFGELYASVVDAAKGQIECINEEGISLVSDVKSALEDVRGAVAKSGKGFGDMYASAVDVAKVRLMSAVSETDMVITSLRSLNDTIVQTSEEYVEESVNRRGMAEKEILEWREKMLAQVDAEIRNARQENNDKKMLLDQREMKLNIEQHSIESRKKALEAYVENEVSERVGMIKSENEDLKERIDDLYAEMDEINKDRADYESKYRKSMAFDKDQLLNENRAIKNELNEMRSRFVSNELQADVIAKAKQYEGLQSKLIETEERLHELECENIKLRRFEGLSSLLKNLTEEQADKIEELKDRIDQIKDAKVSRKYRMEPITKHVFTGKYTGINGDKDIGELEWLEGIKDGIKDEGFEFSDRLVDAFHTSVKTAIWSPITVLAGVSGTGKSELPRLYSQYGGLLFMNTPVKPDWDSPSSMLGYYNALERKFEARPILRAMYQMQENGGDFVKRLSLFLLDEMNLAHIELYFSDMLSKLEENRNKTEEEAAQIDIDLGAGIDSLPIKLTRNMLWVGTMNEDETTKGLSDKVVDRSNIIVFPRPKMLASRELKRNANETRQLFDRAMWVKWQKEYLALCKREEFHKATEAYKETIEHISRYLEKGGRALGHRVWQSIEHYVAACPHVVAGVSEKIDSEDDKKKLNKAFAESVAFKVMPKLRGIETEGKVRKVCLDEIKRVIDDKIPELSADYSSALNAPYGVFMWRSGEFLETPKENGSDVGDNEPKDDGSKK